MILADNPIGKIVPPPNTVPAPSNPTSYVAALVRSGITLLIIGAFVVDLIWIILAGYRFITAGSDEKSVSSAWAQIYWGLIGMVVVVGSFAIIKLVETFFNVNIISGGLKLE